MITEKTSPNEHVSLATEASGLTTFTAIMGFAIQVLRKEKGFTQASLSSDCGISQATISRIELGEADLTVPQIYALCQSLGISGSELFEMAENIREALNNQNINVIDRLPKPSETQKSIFGSITHDDAMKMVPFMSITNPVGLAIGAIALGIIKSTFKK